MITGLGAVTSFFYLVNLKEVGLTEQAKKLDKEFKKKALGEDGANYDDNAAFPKKPAVSSILSDYVMDWQGWLKEGSFYIHGLVYMIVRIAVNVTMVLLFKHTI